MTGEELFWWTRRCLGIRDNDITPEIDEVIRFEIKTTNPISITRIRRILRLPKDDK